VNGDGRLPVGREELIFLLLIHDLDDEELFVVLVVARSEKLIAFEAFAILAALGYLGWGEPDGAGPRFVDVGR
jgi:hypothetical protein